jgi:hypothetical protein
MVYKEVRVMSAVKMLDNACWENVGRGLRKNLLSILGVQAQIMQIPLHYIRNWKKNFRGPFRCMFNYTRDYPACTPFSFKPFFSQFYTLYQKDSSYNCLKGQKKVKHSVKQLPDLSAVAVPHRGGP